ncbi:MAG: formylglycine-generating enzyme family protein [Kofleriaceae bacterium]
MVLLVVSCGGPADVGSSPDASSLLDGSADSPTADSALADASIPDPPVYAPNCSGVADSCGPTSNDDCCESPLISGGTFYRTHDAATDMRFPSTSWPATLSDYRLDKYEVTVGRFRQFVLAGMGTQSHPPAVDDGAHPNLPGSGWQASWNSELPANTAALIAGVTCTTNFHTWTDVPGPNENRPMNCVTSYEAAAFCAWDGGFLPTDAEWNYAAVGGAEQRAYAWSSPAGAVDIDASRASYWLDDTKRCFGDGIDGCAFSDILVVGTKPAGDARWGQSDLMGNVWEWTLDWWYSETEYQVPCDDCANLNRSFYRVWRGGGFNDPARYLRSANRGYLAPGARLPTLGFRCARVP